MIVEPFVVCTIPYHELEVGTGILLHMLHSLGYSLADPQPIAKWDVPSIVRHLHQRYLTGPHRQGSVKQTYERLRDWESYSSVPYVRTHYCTEA
jgi:hypothetical protein